MTYAAVAAGARSTRGCCVPPMMYGFFFYRRHTTPPSRGGGGGAFYRLQSETEGGYSQNGAGWGLRGTFAHGCMLDVWLVECGRAKLTFGELLFAPFA